LSKELWKRRFTNDKLPNKRCFIVSSLSFSSLLIIFYFDPGVVDAKQPARHFTYDELAQLYQFDFDAENDLKDAYDVNRVQDKVLRHLIKDYPDTIASYCEHDSFLIHHDEENLTVEEQKQARDEGNIIYILLLSE
jgi:hypothetical protein